MSSVEVDNQPNVAELLGLVRDYEKEIVKLHEEVEVLKKATSNPVTDSVFIENDELRKQAKSDATLIRTLEDNILKMDEEATALKIDNARFRQELATSSSTSKDEIEIDIIDSKKLLDEINLLRSEVRFYS